MIRRWAYALCNADTKLDRTAMVSHEFEADKSVLCATPYLKRTQSSGIWKKRGHSEQAAKDVGLKGSKKAPAKKKAEKPVAPAPSK
ncbi:MAG TPA: hypothetical protein PKK52_06130 [Syntrophorhabdus sp.]|nr:hypothetical protein [Syntrophorhabdus sp.]